MVTKKLLKQFLTHLYQRHVAEHGESISTLHKSVFTILDESFCDEIPGLIIKSENNTIKRLTIDLAKELQAQGYAKVNEFNFTLTTDGFKEAKCILHPIKCFLSRHWKWYIPVIISAFITILAVIRITQCT